MDTGDAYDAYKRFCSTAGQKTLTPRAFGDLICELGIYGFIRVRVLSRGRYGRSRDIVVELPKELEAKIYETILINFDLARQNSLAG